MTALLHPGLELRSSRAPTLLWCYALLAPAMIFILTAVDRGYQTDLWHHLARGREIVRTRTIVNDDVFTFTVTGQPLIDNNWLTQVIAFGLYQLGGIELVQAINSLLLAAMVSLLLRVGLTLGATMRMAAAVGVVVVAGLSHTLLIRPQTVSMLLFAVLLMVLIRAEQRPAWRWAAPPIMALWANVHGAFPIGLVLIGCFTAAGILRGFSLARSAGRFPDQSSGDLPAGSHISRTLTPTLSRRTGRGSLVMVLIALLSGLATLANPYGYRVYTYVHTTSSRASDRVIQEWLRPDVFTFSGGLWLATIVGVFVLAIIRRQQMKAWMGIVLLVFAGVSCTSVRMSIWWYLAAAPIAMAILPRWGDRPAAPSFAATGMFATLLLTVILCLPSLQRWNPVFALRSPDRPEQSLAQLTAVIADQSPGARVFSRLEWGEYASFALPWKQAVFMDGRIEIYPDTLWDEYRRLTSAEADYQSLLDRYGVNVLLLDRHYHDGLIERIKKSPAWREVATAGSGVVFVRKSSSR